VLNGILWVLGTGGAVARAAREVFSIAETCHRRFWQWIRTGKLEEALRLWHGCSTDKASSTSKKRSSMPPLRAPKRGFAIGATRRGKGTKIVVVAAGNSLPLAVSVFGASRVSKQLAPAVESGPFVNERRDSCDSILLIFGNERHRLSKLSPHGEIDHDLLVAVRSSFSPELQQEGRHIRE